MKKQDEGVLFSDLKTLKISEKAVSKMYSYARAIEAEIGGLMVVEEKNNKDPKISDVLLFEQTANTAGMKLDSKDLAKGIQEIALTEPDKLEKIKGWWHSHYDFGTFWSTTDDNCFKSLLKMMPIVYGVVINQQGNLKARVDIKTKIGKFSVTNLDYKLGKINELKECKKEAKKKVTIEKGFEYKKWKKKSKVKVDRYNGEKYSGSYYEDGYGGIYPTGVH